MTFKKAIIQFSFLSGWYWCHADLLFAENVYKGSGLLF